MTLEEIYNLYGRIARIDGSDDQPNQGLSRRGRITILKATPEEQRAMRAAVERLEAAAARKPSIGKKEQTTTQTEVQKPDLTDRSVSTRQKTSATMDRKNLADRPVSSRERGLADRSTTKHQKEFGSGSTSLRYKDVTNKASTSSRGLAEERSSLQRQQGLTDRPFIKKQKSLVDKAPSKRQVLADVSTTKPQEQLTKRAPSKGQQDLTARLTKRQPPGLTRRLSTVLRKQDGRSRAPKLDPIKEEDSESTITPGKKYDLYGTIKRIDRSERESTQQTSKPKDVLSRRSRIAILKATPEKLDPSAARKPSVYKKGSPAPTGETGWTDRSTTMHQKGLGSRYTFTREGLTDGPAIKSQQNLAKGPLSKERQIQTGIPVARQQQSLAERKASSRQKRPTEITPSKQQQVLTDRPLTIKEQRSVVDKVPRKHQGLTEGPTAKEQRSPTERVPSKGQQLPTVRLEKQPQQGLTERSATIHQKQDGRALFRQRSIPPSGQVSRMRHFFEDRGKGASPSPSYRS